jgi:AraC-like DNA-binding protein
MLGFYKKALVAFLGLAALTALLVYVCIERVFVSDALFPAHESAIPWKFETLTDVHRGGSSTISVTDDIYSLGYEYRLSDDVEYPSVIAVVAFSENKTTRNLVDLSKYSAASFRVMCAPRNVLAFYVYSFDEKVTDPGDIHTYRIARALFTCDEEWSEVEIDLRHLKIPEWWLEHVGVDVADQDYRLDKAVAIAFDNTREGPVNTRAKVKIGELTLRGRDWHPAWAFAGFLAAIWIGSISWLFKQYTASMVAEINSKLKKNRSLMAYRQLSIEPHRDKEKSQVLRFMATEYKNPDMSLEFAVARLGINRAKINELLKDELGMTFNAYLNRLRLAEAARLLSRQGEINVTEIAYSVGYNNVSYFGKLFKNEYGCTPGKFIGLYESKEAD